MSQARVSSEMARQPDHVPDDAVVDLDYHTFGGAADPDFAGDHQLAWKALQDSEGPDLRWTPRNGGHWIALRALETDCEHRYQSVRDLSEDIRRHLTV